MVELCFQSALSMAEIEENFRDFDLFAGLMASLEDVLSYTRGGNPPGILVHELELPDTELAGEGCPIQQP